MTKLQKIKELYNKGENLIAWLKESDGRSTNSFEDIIVRRHIVGGANRTLISVETPLRSCRIGTCRRLSAG